MIDFKEHEKEVLKFWEDNGIYDKVKKKNYKGEKFYFLQGPPYTSGKLHAGHAWNNSMKDMILRYKRMKGLNVWDRGGYDMHGLPTETAVQKKLGLKTKDDILEYGMDKFVKECVDFSVEHAEGMSEDLWKLGVWLDHKNAYYPIRKEYVDGEWAFFKEAWKQGRLYRGKKVMHWDAVTETSLAKHELEYESVKDTSVFLKFKKKNAENEYFIVWTTTPWTIPYNLAIMVNPGLDYVRLKVDGEVWVVAKALSGVFMSSVVGKKAELIEEFKGKELEGQEYEHFFEGEMEGKYEELKKEWEGIHRIILSEKYVDTSAGTGLVHCAPGCGPEDQEAAEAYGIGAFNTLNERGEFEDCGKFNGMTAKVDDKKFIDMFDEKGVLIAKTEVEHDYPHSWRSHKPVVFRTTEQWFVKVKDLVPKLLEMDSEVNWVPQKIGNRYRSWTENLRDINITRQRFWGCPVPVWVNEENKEDYIVVGSSEELEKLSGKKVDDLTIHKPWIDDVLIEKDGKKYKRIEDVADVWIDSASSSWNCLDNDPKLIKEWFPADFILEGTDMTRQWFSVLQIYSSIYMKKSAYKNVFAHGMLLDFQGMKMSKSLGNIISPYEIIDKYSADILRYYMCQVNAGENINFSWDNIKVKQRNLVMLQNILRYIFDVESQKPKKGKASVEDKWILSRYNSMLKEVSELFEQYRLDETIGKIEEFFVMLSRDYIKLVRDRASENSAVLDTLKEVYVGILKVFSTICPFITEDLWQKLREKKIVDGESVHLCDWPKADEKKIDSDLEGEFRVAFEVIEKGLAQRDKERIGLRWPLAKASVVCKTELSEDLREIVARQLNVKKIETDLNEESQIEVSLDTDLTDELEAEGYMREFARGVQAARKKRGLKKGDNVALKVVTSNKVKSRLEKFVSHLTERTNLSSLEFVDDKNVKNGEDFKIREEKVTIELV